MFVDASIVADDHKIYLLLCFFLYQLDAFTQSCPADQDIINHYKLQQVIDFFSFLNRHFFQLENSVKSENIQRMLEIKISLNTHKIRLIRFRFNKLSPFFSIFHALNFRLSSSCLSHFLCENQNVLGKRRLQGQGTSGGIDVLFHYNNFPHEVVFLCFCSVGPLLPGHICLLSSCLVHVILESLLFEY